MICRGKCVFMWISTRISNHRSVVTLQIAIYNLFRLRQKQKICSTSSLLSAHTLVLSQLAEPAQMVQVQVSTSNRTQKCRSVHHVQTQCIGLNISKIQHPRNCSVEPSRHRWFRYKSASLIGRRSVVAFIMSRFNVLD